MTVQVAVEKRAVQTTHCAPTYRRESYAPTEVEQCEPTISIDLQEPINAVEIPNSSSAVKQSKADGAKTLVWALCIFVGMVAFGLRSGGSDSKQPYHEQWDAQNLATLGQIEAKERAPSYSNAASYQDNLVRHHQLGQKSYPSQTELRQYLILDARLSVQEGQMSVSDFESWTGEKY